MHTALTLRLKRHKHALIAGTFYGLLAIFLVLYLKSIDPQVLAAIRVHPGYFILSCLLGLAFRLWGAHIWVTLLRSLGASSVRLSRELVYIYAKSWLGRYIPGTAPWILGKIYFASRQGISKNKLAVSSLLEAALQIIVQMAFALSLLAFDSRLDVIAWPLKLGMLAIVIVSLTVLYPPLFNRVISKAYGLIKKKPFAKEHYATGRSIRVGFSLYIIASVIGALSQFFIAKAIYPELGFDQLLFVMGATTLASAVSMLAIFAPSGLGVREGIQLVLLSLIMPPEYALAITVATRLWSVLLDFVFFGVARAVKRLSVN
ncbi:flippase-like domain-containing protein [Candidatus Saccharibacteria bacterium]|nr:flippase-like domain-containing protein [Candidatus Saccharibacteria bacterium]